MYAIAHYHVRRNAFNVYATARSYVWHDAFIRVRYNPFTRVT